jgi:hypothetical protein
MRAVVRSRWNRNWSRPLLLAFLAAVLIGAAVLLMDAQVAGAAPACTISWTGGGGTTSWFTAANWDQNRLPAASDNVCIPATSPPVTVTYDQNQSTQILSLQSQQALAISTGELTVTDTTQASAIGGGLAWSGGTLGGAGNLVVTEPVSWSGGTKAGTGTLTAGGGMTISGAASKFISGGTVDNPAGQTAVINGTGTFDMANGGSFTNEGTVDDQVDLAFYGGFGFPECVSPNASFSNSGTFIKSGGAGSTSFVSLSLGSACTTNVKFNNSGTVKVNSGTLSLEGGQSSGGSFTVAAGSTLDFSAGGGAYTLDAASSVTGAGTGSFSGGTVSFAAGAAYTTGATTVSDGSVTFGSGATTGGMALSGGTLGGAGNLVVAGPVSWSGGTKAGTGTLTASGGMTISGAAQKVISEGTVVNPAGQTAVINGTGNLAIVNGATFANAGTVDDQADLTIFAPTGGTFFSCSPGGGTITNTGTFIKSGGTGTTIVACSTLAFDNSGTVKVNSGTLSLQSSGASTGGSFAVAAGGTLDFGIWGATPGTYALDAASSVTGDGTGSFSGGTVSFAAGAAYTTGATTVSGGSVTFGSPVSTGTYTQTGGTLGINLGGSASCTVFGQVKVTGAAALAGTLNVGLADGCSPGPAQSFKVMTYASHSGTFASVSTPTVGGQAMPVTYSATDVTVGSITAPGKIVVKKVTDPASDTTTQFTFNPSYGASFQLAGGSSSDSGPLAPGSGYTVTESPTPRWTLTSAACDNGNDPTTGITVTAGQTVTCTFKNQAQGKIVVKKVTDPASDTTTQFTFNPSYGASFQLAGGGSSTSGYLAPGPGYTATESPAPGWDLTRAACDNGNDPTAGITVTAGQTVTCTFTNTERGQARVVKTVNGASLSGTPYSFTFQLRQGASPAAAGTILETATANAANNGVSTFTTLLVPGQTYQLCEQMQPGWLTTLGPPLYSVYNPSGDNSVVCTDFTVSAGQTRAFSIDNKPPPGGMALTIGYWKNWSSCTAGHQAPVLDQMLRKLANGGTPETLGKLVLNPSALGASTACQYAVNILSKSAITGTKMPSDPLFNMASQLLAADLNLAAGAGQCPASATAINSAHALLAKYGFDGKSSSSQLKVTSADATTANNLATTLASYNSDKLC